jgi:G:T-mismatch repair DNA endonuclease (very short patch repair protein)
MREHIKEENNPNFKGGDIELTCQWCGRKFKVFRWWTFRKYCSFECYNNARRLRQGVKQQSNRYMCDYCGIAFYAKRGINSSHHFCSSKCRAKWQSEHFRGKNNPFYRGKFSDKTLRQIIKARITKPNRSERALIRILSENNLPFKYVGNGEVVIGGKNPDFIHSAGQRKVIELFGIYWHSPLYGKVKPTMTYDAVVRHYAEHGYECLVLWDTELQNEKLIVNRITKFIGGMKVAPNIMVE